MDWLNYHHLLYFHAVVEEGSIAGASRRLHVGRPSISMQLKSLEAYFGEPLFERRGRRLDLTETGRVVHGYADEIFRTGRELVDEVRGRATTGRRRVFRVGIADAMTKSVAFRLLLPALDDATRLVCREGGPDRLLAALAVHDLDLVLSDVPLRPGVDVRAYDHAVGSSTITFFAKGQVARRLRADFPTSLDGAPVLLPGARSSVRRLLDAWFDEQDVRPHVVAEFEDSALLKVFGREGRGVFPAPTVVADEVVERYRVRPIGEVAEVRESYYAISAERRIEHPSVARLVDQARRHLFS